MVGDILQPTHLLFVLVVALLVLGPKRLPEVARTLGKGIRDFRGAISGDNDDHPSFLGQDHSAPASTPEAHEASPATATAAPATTVEAPDAGDPLGHTEPPVAAPVTPAATTPEPPVAPPVTPATTTPDPSPAAVPAPQPAVPATDAQPAVTPATTAPDPDDKSSQAPRR